MLWIRILSFFIPPRDRRPILPLRSPKFPAMGVAEDTTRRPELPPMSPRGMGICIFIVAVVGRSKRMSPIYSINVHKTDSFDIEGFTHKATCVAIHCFQIDF